MQKNLPGRSPSATVQERILIIDDEDLIRETVALALTEQGYQVVTAESGHRALELMFPAAGDGLTGLDIDLAIVDLMLPGVNGLDICRMMRHHNLAMPIMILSAKGTEMDRVVGLEVGADDYLPKPFGMRELIARCRALLRRHQWSTSQPDSAVLTYRDIVLHATEFRVLVAGQEVNLSPKEFRILELFMQSPNRVWSREELIQTVWGADFVGDRKTVDVHIRWLREKIEHDPAHPQYVTTLRGFGYRFG
ncbi:response regulator transcription factor [Phormidium tenue]|uniref:DNA-binding response regulator n=1 Tax=Phormidium tenue NIES-30 TaxID=549789 RepID=A0A1U7J336_9CYAN|nr:response regulator transcription factor [Phormidium tenue]MBD2233258.1 response regulator transcription factor [Phormidium tenue FACHB-1052]OKH46568.1 DNA-binding response regulator [Phormidium tenue NIES-30]